MQDVVDIDDGRVGVSEPGRKIAIKPVEIALDGLPVEILETVDHEIGRLQIGNDIVGPHDAIDIQRDPVRAFRFGRKNDLRRTGQDACTIGLDAVGFLDKPEFDGVPVQRAERLQPIVTHRFPARTTVFLHVVGENRVGQHRHMAEHVVKYVGFLDVIERLARADEIAGGETSVRQMPEEHVVRDQHGHGNDAPTGQSAQFLRHGLKVRHASSPQIELFQPRQESAGRAPRQDVHLAREQVVPDRVVFRRILGLRRFDPVIADMVRLFQRRREDVGRQIGKAGKILLRFC